MNTSELIHRENFGTVALCWSRDQSRSRSLSRRFLREWLLKTKHERQTWKAGIVSSAWRRRNETGVHFTLWFQATRLLSCRRVEVEAVLSERDRNRCISIYVTAFVCWRHTMRKLAAEGMQVSVLSRVRLLRYLKGWKEALWNRTVRTRTWESFIRAKARHSLRICAEHFMSNVASTKSAQSLLTASMTGKLFGAWKQRRILESTLKILAGRYLMFWIAITLFHQEKRWRCKRSHFLDWARVMNCIVMHKCTLIKSTLLVLRQEVVSKHVSQSFRAWVTYTQQIKKEVLERKLVRCLKAWKQRRYKNLNLIHIFHKIRLKKFMNIFHSILDHYRFLIRVDQWAESSQMRITFQVLRKWCFVEKPREARTSWLIVNRQSKLILNAFMSKWVAMTASLHKWTVRRFMSKKRSFLRWVAYTLVRRGKSRLSESSLQHYCNRLKRKVCASLFSHLQAVRVRNTVVIPDRIKQRLERQLWVMWVSKFRPVLLRDKIERKRIERHREKLLYQKSFRVLLIYKFERSVKHRERVADKHALNTQLRMVYWKSVVDLLRHNETAARVLRNFSRRTRAMILHHWLAATRHAVLERASVETKSKHLCFRRFKRQISGITKFNAKIHRNIFLKFFEKWVQFICFKAKSNRCNKRIFQRLCRNSFVIWMHLTLAIKRSATNTLQRAANGWLEVCRHRQTALALRKSLLRRRLRELKQQASVNRSVARIELIARRVARRWKLFVSRRKEEKLKDLTSRMDRIRQQLIFLRE